MFEASGDRLLPAGVLQLRGVCRPEEDREAVSSQRFQQESRTAQVEAQRVSRPHGWTCMGSPERRCEA